MKTLTLYIITDGSDIEAAADSSTALERWTENIGSDENLRSYTLQVQVPEPKPITITLREEEPVVS